MTGLSPSEFDLISQFLESLRQIPDVRVDPDSLQPASSGQKHDAQVDIVIADKRFTVLIEAKTAVYPRDVAQIMWQLKSPARSENSEPDRPTLPLLVAGAISPGAKELLREEGIGYFDTGGSLYLRAAGAYCYIDKPPPKILTRSIQTLFSGSRSQVLRALLAHPTDWFGGTEIATRAQVSPATASQVLTELDRLGWSESRGQGPGKERRLQAPAALLDEWVKRIVALPRLTLHRYYLPSRGEDLVERVGRLFSEKGVMHAFTSQAAAQRYAPFLSQVPLVHVRTSIDATTQIALEALGAQTVTEGANLTIIETRGLSEFLFRQEEQGVWLVSPLQVYLDLLRGEGRAREMAAHLRKEKIGF